MAVRKSKHLFIFQLKFAFAHGHCAYFFNCWSEAFGVTCVARPEQLVPGTPLLPCAMPKDGQKERGHVCLQARRLPGWVVCVWILFQRMVLIQTRL
jgi:hypothetical protein